MKCSGSAMSSNACAMNRKGYGGTAASIVKAAHAKKREMAMPRMAVVPQPLRRNPKKKTIRKTERMKKGRENGQSLQ
jgi:hypothetical protein